MHCIGRIRPFAGAILGIAAGVGTFQVLTAGEEPAWARARHADELGAPLFASAEAEASVSYLGEGLPEPDWSRADFLLQEEEQEELAEPEPEIATPVGPLTSTGDGGQRERGSSCSTQAAPGSGGNCSTDGRGAGGSPQYENCSAVEGNGQTACSSGGMGNSGTSHCSAGGSGTGQGESASCSTGSTALPGAGKTNGTCSAAVAGSGGGNVDCSTYGGGGDGSGGSAHMSCSVGNSTGGTCSAKAGGEGSSGSAFCSASGSSGGGSGFGNKCSVAGYPGGGSGSGQSCSVLTKTTASGATCSVKAGSNGACTVIAEGKPPEGMGTCSSGNVPAQAESPAVIVCSTINEEGENQGPDPKTGLCGTPHQHPKPTTQPGEPHGTEDDGQH